MSSTDGATVAILATLDSASRAILRREGIRTVEQLAKLAGREPAETRRLLVLDAHDWRALVGELETFAGRRLFTSGYAGAGTTVAQRS